jgi:lipid II:glycine glycyltransferase (peptidoglycan interpeptide bridge formation enzyme)
MRSSLVGGEEAVLAGMKTKTRYNIALARRRGVVVRSVGAAELDSLWDLYAETARRDGFAVRDRDYYMDAWTSFLADGRAVALLGEKEGDPVAGALVVALGPTAFYLYGATASDGRRDMPAYLVQWESLRWAIDQGCRIYDWWGGPTSQTPDDPLWGVQRYKLGFGAQLVERLGAWDLALSAGSYVAYAAMSGLRRRLARARARRN